MTGVGIVEQARAGIGPCFLSICRPTLGNRTGDLVGDLLSFRATLLVQEGDRKGPMWRPISDVHEGSALLVCWLTEAPGDSAFHSLVAGDEFVSLLDLVGPAT